jgi:hypothetical protein
MSEKISALTPKTVPGSGDLLAIVDVSDMSTPPAGPAGSNKKTTVGQLETVVIAAIPTAATGTQGTVLPPGGTTDYLRADGTWAAPSGGGSDTTGTYLTRVFAN